MRGELNWQHLPDRKWIQREYLPQLSGTILYVGVEQYNDFYHELVNGLLTTIDNDESKTIFGSPHCHIVGHILNHNSQYDHVACYGLLGYCIFEKFDIYHRHLDSLVLPGGSLMLGHHITDQHTMNYWNKSINYDNYKDIVRNVSGVTSNFIWWGRKIR